MKKTIAIVGAGISGLACARRLVAAGAQVQLFEKSHGPGGRLATRRLPGSTGDVSLDHGAQYFTAREPAFSAQCAEWLRLGVVTAWDLPLHELTASGRAVMPIERRYLGAPGMNTIPQAMAQGLSLQTGSSVTALTRLPSGWQLHFENGDGAGAFDALVLALPAEQAAPLLRGTASRLATEAANCVTAPCWAGLFVFAAEHPPFAARVRNDGPLAWLARGRDARAWIVHAGAGWSRQWLEASSADVADQLGEALRTLRPSLGEPVLAQAHRWRYALVERAAGTAFAWDETLQLGVCGDWRLGPRVEWAWRSGDSLAAAMLA